MRKLGAFLFLPLICRAEQLPVKRYTTADGLAGNRIESIFRDSRGFLWFGTTEGLSRFDGYQFTNFTAAQGLPASFVTQIIETRGGVYWIATSAGPCRFDPARRGSASPFQSFRLDGRMATALVEDHNGAIWCGTYSGLFRLSPLGKAFESVDIGMPLAAGGDGAIVSALLEDSQKTLWVGAGGALYRRTADGRTSRYTSRDGLPEDFGFVQDLLEDREGQIWIGTRKGVCRTGPRPQPGRPPIVQIYDSRSGLPGLAWTNSLFQTSDGKLWVGAGELNLFTGRPGAEAFRTYTRANGLAEGSVEVLGEDRAGNLWIGTDGNGAMKIAHNGFVRFDEQGGLSNLDSILESRRGELCVIAEVGTGKHLQRIFEWFDGRRFIPIRPAFPRSLTNFGWGCRKSRYRTKAASGGSPRHRVFAGFLARQASPGWQDCVRKPSTRSGMVWLVTMCSGSLRIRAATSGLARTPA